MWTWQFELNDILTTLTIVGVVAGAGYRLLIIPLLQQLDSQRMQDNLIFQEKWGVLTDTLKDLKDEIKLSRAERIKAESKQVLLSAKVEALEVRVDDIKEELHEHTAKSHQYNSKILQFYKDSQYSSNRDVGNKGASTNNASAYFIGSSRICNGIQSRTCFR